MRISPALVVLALSGAPANSNALSCSRNAAPCGLSCVAKGQCTARKRRMAHWRQAHCAAIYPSVSLKRLATHGPRFRPALDLALRRSKREIARCYFENERSPRRRRTVRATATILADGRVRVAHLGKVYGLLLHCVKTTMEDNGVSPTRPGPATTMLIDIEAKMAHCADWPRRTRYRSHNGTLPEED